VAVFPPEGYSVWDMIGNVWEWTVAFLSLPDRPAAASARCGCSNPRVGPPRGDERISLPGHQGRLAA
jgi:formylglycine-generating enzyme